MNQISIGWDPLEAVGDTDKDVVAAAKKREIKNILKSYVSNYDHFSEIIQNAMDAAEKRFDAEGGDAPKLVININLNENSLQVIDNGCGFEDAEFRAFLAPSISFKNGTDSRGNKGVGVTYIAYGFNDLTIRTKNEYFNFQGTIRKGRDWIEDTGGSVSRPNIVPVDSVDEFFESLDKGTSFKIVFKGANIRPSNLDWYKANTAEQWLYLLLVKTPLGAVALPEMEGSGIKFDLNVIDRDGNCTSLSDIDAKYKYPHCEISASQKLSVIVEAQKKALDASKDTSKAIEKYKKSNGIYEVYGADALKNMSRTLDDYELGLIDQYNVCAYGYFAYSTEVWDVLNDKKAGLRQGLRIIRGGLQICSNKMVQGESITIPLTKSIGHQKQAHVIVHFDGAEPDLGRKGFQPELKILAEKIAVSIVRQLSARKDVLKSDTGAQADIEKDIAVNEWLRQQEDYEKVNPLHFNSDEFFLPTKKISINSVPQSEQDVIVLFSQLIAGGVVRGIKLLTTSQQSQYDGVFRYTAEDPLVNYHFDRLANPLGVLGEQLTASYTMHPKILEYKYSLDGLIREFESGIKNEKDIALAVFWEMGEEYKREYDVISLLDFDKVQHRDHHGLTHVLTSSNSKFAVICLKELFQLLNNPEESQRFQQAEYGLDI